MMRWTRDPYTIEMTSCPPGSVDPRAYVHTFVLDPNFKPAAQYGLTCLRDGSTCGSATLATSIGRPDVHPHACVLLDDRCIVAVGTHVCALGLPDLALRWELEADRAACLGLYQTADDKHVVVHGELEICKITVDGRREWAYAGRDIFTGDCTLVEGAVLVADFNGQRYAIDLERGTGSIVHGRR
jgi:hypothetical protein